MATGVAAAVGVEVVDVSAGYDFLYEAYT